LPAIDSNEIETQLGIYLKLFVILYADDTVLMAESSADLQNQLNSFQDYCSIWPFNEKLRFLGSLPLEKTITLLLSVFTLSFQIEQ
jgi:hypothetical protein